VLRPKVEADQRLADREQERGHGRTDPDVAPADANARDDLVDHRERHRHEGEADDEVEQLGDDGPAADERRRELAEGGDGGAGDEREDEQEADAEHHAEGQQARADERPETAAAGAPRRTPDAVERVLQLAEDRDRAEAEQDGADDRPERALRRVRRRSSAAPAPRPRPDRPSGRAARRRCGLARASAPKTRPAIEMTMSSSGASENSV
jgi:hypothetical protein